MIRCFDEQERDRYVEIINLMMPWKLAKQVRVVYRDFYKAPGRR